MTEQYMAKKNNYEKEFEKKWGLFSNLFLRWPTTVTTKANSIAAKANLLRQKQIRNGKSKFVAAKANWKWQQPVGKSRKQICHGKSKFSVHWGSAKQLTNTENRSWQKQKSISKISGESVLIAKAKSLRQKQISYFTATYHVTKANSFVAKANHLRVAQKQQLVPGLPLDPFRRTGCKIARHCRMESVRYLYSSIK